MTPKKALASDDAAPGAPRYGRSGRDSRAGSSGDAHACRLASRTGTRAPVRTRVPGTHPCRRACRALPDASRASDATDAASDVLAPAHDRVVACASARISGRTAKVRSSRRATSRSAVRRLTSGRRASRRPRRAAPAISPSTTASVHAANAGDFARREDARYDRRLARRRRPQRRGTHRAAEQPRHLDVRHEAVARAQDVARQRRASSARR